MPWPVVGISSVVVGAVSVAGAVLEPAVVLSVPLVSVSGVALVVVASSPHAAASASQEIKP
jgi:hypothetical protein